jgi:hypothetical protein
MADVMIDVTKKEKKYVKKEVVLLTITHVKLYKYLTPRNNFMFGEVVDTYGTGINFELDNFECYTRHHQNYDLVVIKDKSQKQYSAIINVPYNDKTVFPNSREIISNLRDGDIRDIPYSIKDCSDYFDAGEAKPFCYRDDFGIIEFHNQKTLGGLELKKHNKLFKKVDQLNTEIQKLDAERNATFRPSIYESLTEQIEKLEKKKSKYFTEAKKFNQVPVGVTIKYRSRKEVDLEDFLKIALLGEVP